MNILTDALPRKIEGIAIRTDFRVWLRVMAIIEKVEASRLISDHDYFFNVMTKISRLIYPIIPELYTGYMFADIVNFLRCKGAEQTNPEKAKKSGSNKSVTIFDMEFDSGAIYASFLGEFGIDLLKIKHLHWYAFNALLNNLSDDSPLRIRTKLRGLKSSEVPKDKLKEFQRVQELYSIPASEADLSAKEKLTEFLQKGGK